MAKDKEPQHYVLDLFHKGANARRPHVRNYWKSLAFLLGHQWTYWSKETQRIDVVPNKEDTIRATINRLWPSSRTIMAKLTQRHLQFEVSPNNADDVAIEGAKLSESILTAVARDHEWENVRASTAWNAWLGGTAAVCVTWDPTLGKPTALADDGQALPSGDTVETPLSVADFVLEPGAKDGRTAGWWIHVEALPPAQVQRKWDLAEEPAADATAGLSHLESKLLGSNPAAGPNGAGTVSTPLTSVLTYYERPSKRRPKGRVAVVVGNEEVWAGDWPFPWQDHLNIAFCTETHMSGQAYGETVFTNAIPIQASYNAMWSNILEHFDKVGNARLLTPQSAMELADQYSDVIGEQVVYVDGMDRPEWMSSPQLPQWMMEAIDRASLQMDDMLGVHDISRGSTPSNIESGYGLAVLAEQDATPIGAMAKSQAEMWAQVATMVLRLYESEVSEKRTALVQTPGLPPMTTEWTGKDIAGQTTATVPLDLVMPRSRAAMMQQAEKLLQMGLITTIEEFVRAGESPDERQILEAVRPDVARARRENARLALGQVREAEDWDAHDIHIVEHNNFRRSSRYDFLAPAIKDLIADHVQAHETLAAEAAGRQQLKANVGGPALAMAPTADQGPIVEPQELAPPEVDPNALPPPEEQTTGDMLSNDVVAAVARQDAEAASAGAAVDQGDLERDAVLELAQIQAGLEL